MSPFDTPAILLTSDGGALSGRANRKFAAGAGVVAPVLRRRHRPSERRESGRGQRNTSPCRASTTSRSVQVRGGRGAPSARVLLRGLGHSPEIFPVSGCPCTDYP